ncbi:phosphatidylglycerol lysyltransferase domain-containing protein [Leptolyngbya sp. FACHB-8]|uniref:phosphatidylglycerol lysyltransferase domain-containing protein n=1 Tax=unclassified Leptolyngbya TaxID=2650499 RepID=UPI00168589B5|nr:phosphatidylglycerol lysyltransferase domain-containing protein [Leptolyngbya sp. FACHB-8]MBD1911838.1 bifunctional lysylphosphatidylglycerol flippase/synthetase MprF [Leptolyngbya sp. FACHB-8]
MLNSRTRIALWMVAFLTGFVGLVNLLSAVTPSLPNRIAWLREIFPFEVRTGGHLFAAIAGFFLLALATNLLRRKQVAWLLTVILLVISIISHLVKGWDYEEALLSAGLLVVLITMRPVFTAQSDRPSIAQGARVLLGALLFTLAYGTAGFYFLDRHYSIEFDLLPALRQTIVLFFTDDNAGLRPTTRFGKYFVDSIYIISIVTFGYALTLLLRPVLLRGAASTKEHKHAQAIVEAYGRSSLARLTLLDDKSYYFSPSGKTVVAYVAKGRGAIALGDPIGPASERREAILSFQKFCAQNDWYPAFYQTLPDDLELYYSLGFRVLQIGEEAIVDLNTFTLSGKAAQNLRTARNKLTKAGHTVEFHQPRIGSALLHELKTVSDEWLRLVNGSEKRFSLGWFDDQYLQDCEIALVRTPDGHISAFANVITEYQHNDITIDLMRRRIEIEHGTMDFLFTSMFQHYKERGYDGFNLGLSALSGVGQTEEAARLEKAVHYLYQHLNQFYNFQGLHSYKEKFSPRWEPRYLVYPSLVALPDILVGLVRADSGDRLLDYFKPGS